MKIECTAKEIADLVEKIQSRQCVKTDKCSSVFIHKSGTKLTCSREDAKLDACGNPFTARFDCFLKGGERMNFGKAIEALKNGKRVKRAGWNGKNQYIELATNISYKNANGEIINCEHEAIGNNALAFVGTSGVQMGWLASQADMLAEDWLIIG